MLRVRERLKAMATRSIFDVHQLTRPHKLYGDNVIEMYKTRSAVFPNRLSNVDTWHSVLLWLLVGALVVRQRVFIRKRYDFLTIDSYAIAELVIMATTLLLILYRPRVLGRAWMRIWGSCAAVFILYHAFGALSALWSPFPAFSFYRAIQQLIEILAIFLAMWLCCDLVSAERRLVTISAVVLLSNLIWLTRVNGFAQSLALWHSGPLSAAGGILTCYCFGELLTGKRWSKTLLFGALGGFACLALGTSSASICSATCGIMLGAVLSRNWRILVLGTLTLTTMIAVGVGSSTVKAILFPGKSNERIMSLTGRIYLWEDYLEQFKERPLSGQGYAIPARVSDATYATNTHNSYLSVIAGTGLIGATFVLAMCVLFIYEIKEPVMRMKPGAIGCISAMTAGVINCGASSILFECWRDTSVVLVTVLAIYALFVRSVRRKKFPFTPRKLYAYQTAMLRGLR